MLSLLDTDLILMKAATASETEIDWGEDNVWSLYMDLERRQGKQFSNRSKTSCEAVETDVFVCCLSDPNANFRVVVDPTYKSGRRKEPQAGRLQGFVRVGAERIPISHAPTARG